MRSLLLHTTTIVSNQDSSVSTSPMRMQVSMMSLLEMPPGLHPQPQPILIQRSRRINMVLLSFKSMEELSVTTLHFMPIKWQVSWKARKMLGCYPLVLVRRYSNLLMCLIWIVLTLWPRLKNSWWIWIPTLLTFGFRWTCQMQNLTISECKPIHQLTQWTRLTKSLSMAWFKMAKIFTLNSKLKLRISSKS